MVNYDYDSSILNNTEYIRKQLHCSRTIDRQLPLVVDLAHSAQAGPEFVLLTYQTRRNVSAVCTCQPIYNWGYLLNFI